MRKNSQVDILAVGVHPDDIELSAAGTLLKHAHLGHSFAILDLTQGELGSRGNRETRKKEAAYAAEILGAQERFILDIGDGFFTHNEENLRQIIQYIRYFSPKVVLCNALEDRHPDHGRSAKLVADACFYSGLLKIETNDPITGAIQEQHRPDAVYHYIQDRNLKPDFVVDITPFFEQKMKAILAYKTQFYQKDNEGPQTPISGKSFIDFMAAKGRSFGRDIQAEYAEGFNVARTPGVEDILSLR